jgi:hypothetical protein
MHGHLQSPPKRHRESGTFIAIQPPAISAAGDDADDLRPGIRDAR